MVWQRAAVYAALFLFGSVLPLTAQDVTLTSRDGAVEITGNLLGFDGEFYRVDTRFGELTVDGSGVLCDGPGCPNLQDFVAEVSFSGSSTMAEILLPALIEGFARQAGQKADRVDTDDEHFHYELRDASSGKAQARFYFRVTTTDEGFADLLANESDVVMALREIRPDELDRAAEAGLGDLTGPRRARVLALDAIVPLVAPDNPVRSISTPDLARVFSGQLTNWSDLGGPDAPIGLHVPAPGSGLAQAVEDYLLRPAKLNLSQNVTRHSVNSAMVAAVETDPFGIGMASFAETGAARVLTLTGGCGHDLTASRRAIKTEDYPLTSPIFLYLPVRRLPKAGREFLAYTRSPAAQTVVRGAGFVDQAVETIAMNTQGDRLANAIYAAGDEVTLDELRKMVGFMKSRSRLTMSFRFEPGSTRPDAQSRDNIVRLATSIEAGEYDGRQLVFVGFSDGDGAANTNRRISRARANAVRRAVMDAAETKDAGQLDISVEAFGEALPMACDDSDWGRKVNRRVEVWVN